MADQEGRFEGVEEIAERLLVDPQTVRRWIKSGKLKAYKPGREYRIKSTDLEEFLETREVGPKAPAPSPESSSVTALPDAEERIDYRAIYFEKRREHLELLEDIIAEAGEVMGTEDYEEFIKLPYDEQTRRITHAERLTNLVYERLKHFDKDDLPEELEHKVTHLRTRVEEFKKSA